MQKVSIASVFALLLLCSCRTYGGYGTEEATLTAIQQANRLFAESLDRASRDGQGLDRLAESRLELVEFAERYNALLDRHHALVRRHGMLATNLRADFGSYRNLKIVFDAVVAEQQGLRSDYRSFAQSLESAVSGAARRQVDQIGSRYFAAPPYYTVVEGKVTTRSLSDILAELEGTG